jgi:hypothetical protein
MPDTKPQRILRVPTGDAFDNLQDDGRRYRVLHHGVGSLQRGSDLRTARDFGPGADIERLLNLGAIREVTAREMDELEAATKEAKEEGKPAPEEPLPLATKELAPMPAKTVEGAPVGKGSAPKT